MTYLLPGFWQILAVAALWGGLIAGANFPNFSNLFRSIGCTDTKANLQLEGGWV